MEKFQKNVPQCNIAKTEDFIMYNIIARFSESGETGATGQGHESVLACDS